MAEEGRTRGKSVHFEEPDNPGLQVTVVTLGKENGGFEHDVSTEEEGSFSNSISPSSSSSENGSFNAVDNNEIRRQRKTEEPTPPPTPIPTVSRNISLDSTPSPPSTYDGDSLRDPEYQSNTLSLGLAYFICFLIAISFSGFFTSIWPYLVQIDPSSDIHYLGLIVAAYSLGQAVTSPLFNYWNQRCKVVRMPVIVGVLFMIISNALYAFTQAFDSNRVWILLVARFCMGAGSGVIAPLRWYAGKLRYLTGHDRAKSITIMTAFFSLGVVAGPAIQAAFTPLGHPGYKNGVFHFDMYTAPAFLSLLLDLIVFVGMFTIFRENVLRERSDSSSTLNSINSNDFWVLPKFDKGAAGIVIATWFVMMAAVTNLETLSVPYTMIMFDWDRAEAVLNNAILAVLSGIIAVATYVFFSWQQRSMFNERLLIMIGMAFIWVFYMSTFSWWWYTTDLNYYLGDLHNRTAYNSSLATNFTTIKQRIVSTTVEPIGCNLEKYSWCKDTKKILPTVFYILYVICLGIGYPVINVSLSTLFSKILGPRRQTTMQNVLFYIGCIARIFGPILFVYWYSYKGPRVSWGVIVGLILILILPWAFGYQKLVPLKADRGERLRAGSYFAHKSGMVYKF